jgi:hypothetical protein
MHSGSIGANANASTELDMASTATTSCKCSSTPDLGNLDKQISGWKDGVLQKALDARCSGNKCSQLKTQTAAEATKCAKSQAVQEPYDGCRLHSFEVFKICTDTVIQGWISFPVELPSRTPSFIAFAVVTLQVSHTRLVS